MKMYANWVHGNALRVESPENVGRFQHVFSGTNVLMTPGKSSWFHIAVPSPVVIGDVRAQLQRVFILFDIPHAGHITELHLYDGPNKIREIKQLELNGTHIWSLDTINTFNLPSLHSVRWGIGISFLFAAGADTEGGSITPSILIVGSAGGDFMA